MPNDPQTTKRITLELTSDDARIMVDAVRSYLTPFFGSERVQKAVEKLSKLGESK